MTVHVREDPADVLPDGLETWRRLADDAGLPYATPEWMLAFWRHLHAPTGARARIMVVRDDADEVIGLAPFYAERRPLGVTEYRLFGSGIGQRTGLLARPGQEDVVAAAVAEALRAEDPPPALVHLDALDPTTPWDAMLAGRWPARLTPRVRETRREPALAATMAEDFDTWFAARSRRFRERVRRRRRQIEERGGVIRRSRTIEELRSDLAALFALHRAWFEASGRRSSIDERYEAAVTEAACGLFERDATRLWVVEADGRVVGAQLAFRAGDRVCGWSGGMDPAWSDVSVGFVLVLEVIRDAHELGARVLDFGAGDDEYKERLADHDEPVAWRDVLVRDKRYPYTRARLAPEDAGLAARRAAGHLPSRARRRLHAVGAALHLL